MLGSEGSPPKPMFAAPQEQELDVRLLQPQQQPETAGQPPEIPGRELLPEDQRHLFGADLNVTRNSGIAEPGWRLKGIYGDQESGAIKAVVQKVSGEEAGAEKAFDLNGNNWLEKVVANNQLATDDEPTVPRDIILKLRSDSDEVPEDPENLAVSQSDTAAEEVGQRVVSGNVKVEDVSQKQPALKVELTSEQESNIRESGNLVDDPLFKQLLDRFGIELSPEALKEAVSASPEFAEAFDSLIDARLVELNNVWRENHAIEDEYYQLVEDPSYTDYYPGHRPEEKATIHNMRPPERFHDFLGSGQRKNHPITGENLSSRQHIKNIVRDYLTGDFDYKKEGTDPIVGRVYKHFEEPNRFIPGRVRPRRYQVTLGSHRSVAQLVAYGQTSFDQLK